MCKLIKYGMMLVAVAMVALIFVLPFVGTSTGAIITTITADYGIAELFEMDASSALSASITAIVCAVFVGLAIILAVCDDLKVAKLAKVAMFVAVLAALAGIACLVSTVVLTSEMADGILVGITSTDVSIGFASFGALLAGLFCAGAMFVPCKKAKSTKKKSTSKKSTSKKK